MGTLILASFVGCGISHQANILQQLLTLLSNLVFLRSGTNTGCLSFAQNLTFPPSNKFNLILNQKDIMLFFGYDLSSMPGELIEHRIGCSQFTLAGMGFQFQRLTVRTVVVVVQANRWWVAREDP